MGKTRPLQFAAIASESKGSVPSVDLNETLVRHWYAANDYTVIGGRIPVAIDGNTLEIPNTAKLREVYGETGGKQAPGLAHAQMSHAYDVANGICLSAVLDRYDASERDLALRNMQAVYGLVPQSLPISWLFDRGYPGLAFCMQIEQMGAQFLMRVKESFYLEEFAAVAKDGWITLVVTKRRAQELARAGNPLPVGTVLRLRVIKITLANGNQEILITNVPATLLAYKQAEAVYHLRWGVGVSR